MRGRIPQMRAKQADSDPRLQCVFPREIEGFRSLRLRLALVRQHETLRFGESSGRI